MGEETQYGPLENDSDQTQPSHFKNKEISPSVQPIFSFGNIVTYLISNKYIQASTIIFTLYGGIHLIFGISIVNINSYTKNSYLEDNYIKKTSYEEKIKNKNEELSSLRHENNKIYQENLYLKDIIEPFQDRAKEIYPEMEITAALAKLSDDIKDIRNLASKDIYRPLNPTIRRAIIDALNSIQEKYHEFDPSIIIKVQVMHKHRMLVSSELANIIDESNLKIKDIKHNFWYRKEMTNVEIEFNPEGENFAQAFARTLSVFLNTKFTGKNNEELDRGTLIIAVFGEPLFLPNGTVIFK